MQTYYVVIDGMGFWGRGLTINAAKTAARQQGANLRRYVTYVVPQPADKPQPYVEGANLVHYGDPFDDSVRVVESKQPRVR